MTPAKILPNGARVIERRGDYVLAHFEDNSYTPYVTWAINDRDETFWGHYHKTITEAAKEFEERAGGHTRYNRALGVYVRE